MEQQRNAFHELGIETQLLEDFLASLAPYKPKSLPQFPPPESLYKKKFAFLPAPLVVLQKSRRATDPVVSCSKQKTDMPRKESTTMCMNYK